MSDLNSVSVESDRELIQESISEVSIEMMGGLRKFGPYNSTHEAWAVIREEMDELWDVVKEKEEGGAGEIDRLARMREEAIQVAATSLRLCCELKQTIRNR